MMPNIELIKIEGGIMDRSRRGVELKTNCGKKLLLEGCASMWLGIHVCLLVDGGTCDRDEFVAAELFIKPGYKHVNVIDPRCKAVIEDLLDGGSIVTECGSWRLLWFIEALKRVAVADRLPCCLEEGPHFTVVGAGAGLWLFHTLPSEGNLTVLVISTGSQATRCHISCEFTISPSF